MNRLDINNIQSSDEKSIEILKDIFENTNRWLNFAEAKNGAIIGVNGLFLFKSIEFLFEAINDKLKAPILIVGFIITILLLGILIELKSFFPNTSVYNDEVDCLDSNSFHYDENVILIFYGDICKYKSSKLYLRDIYKYYLDKDIEIEELKKIELDYAKEILINSRITSYKYKLFKMGLKLNFLSIFIFYIFLIIA